MSAKTELTILFVVALIAIGSFRGANPKFLSGFIAGDTAVSNKLVQLLNQYQEAPFHLDDRTKEADCRINGPLPDHECTPGAIFPEATLEKICVKGYTKTVRNVSVGLKRKIYTAYGIPYPQKTGTYEADHLIPLAIGGNNDIANLFPEAQDPRPGFREKDLVEVYLQREVCARRIALGAAQQQVAADWVGIYETLTPDQLTQLKRAFWDD
ncbi:MAG: hypothetical protein A3A33_04685 [Candidatus Yanofskybacteria bacterium RIFCSPLOWO2_01_FULL_49_25]|uniref:HNH nuclease domain-containing protein n=1 Tax=Candidatus Yanofskybacteria bacterium RIFCSPLOWO2_01_FULL_49_25 TaxID=1802701 RepID=A0A1F8GPZ7_9BACT|nr:MAG: hypothetical protein A3A33_04685 [Candidatus Yanofskybacteria bacterium RIFCSPLOWO2_01_FULL_49_25]